MIKRFVQGDALVLEDLLECYDGDVDIRARVENFVTAPNSEMFTLWKNDRAVACFGFLVQGHTMTIWALASQLIKKYPFAYHRSVKATLEYGISKYEVKRVQSVVDVGNEIAVKQHAALGFTLEGTMTKSGGRMQDEYLFARIV